MKCLCSFVLILAWPLTGMAEEPRKSEILGKKIDELRLREYRGAEMSLRDMADKKLVVVTFIGTECPVALLYAPRIVELAKEYEPKGVGFMSINSNVQDSIADLTGFAKSTGFSLPILKDANNTVADRFGAVRTPETYLLDADRIVRYRGRIDDQYGVGFVRPKPTSKDLSKAIDELLAGKPVTQASTESTGCYIGRVQKPAKEGSITYSKQIAPILHQRCLSCHRPGEIGPFSMTSYDEVIGWTEMIQEVIKEERMPPWHADGRYGKWTNDAHLPEAEKQLLFKWIEAGAPRGNPIYEPPLPPFTDGWQIPKPDVVLSLPKPVKIPSSGTVPYQYIVVETGFTEDKWVQAVEVRPTCKAVVHHALVFVQPPGGAPSTFRGFASNWLAATVPNGKPMIWPTGQAKLIPAGSRLLFQLHYTTTGAPQEDQTTIGMCFADPKSVKQEVSTEMAANNKLSIPPGAANHVVEATVPPLKEPMTLLQLMPHTHLRGKAFKYEALYPDGTREILIDVPRYDFNWQNSYRFAEPKTIPAGTRLHCTAVFDNSTNNKSNPDPKATVRWGEQTYEEMMIGYFDVVKTNQDLQKNPIKAAQVKRLPTVDPAMLALAKKALASQEDFDALAKALHEKYPTLARTCATSINNDMLRVEKSCYTGAVGVKVAETGFANNMKLFALSGYAMLGRKVVNPELGQARGMDMSMMGKTLSSSLHFPMAFDGRPATINFWSGKANAFTPEMQDYLEAVVQALKSKS